ncbi:MAG: transposase, partial [Planctomycetota bacterium]
RPRGASFTRKASGKARPPSRLGHVISGNRHGLILATGVSEANGRAGCHAASDMLDGLHTRRGIVPATLGADKGYDNGPWMIELEGRGITPHAAMREGPVGRVCRREKKDRPLIAARQRMAERHADEGYRLGQRLGRGLKKTSAGARRSRPGKSKTRRALEDQAATGPRRRGLPPRADAEAAAGRPSRSPVQTDQPGDTPCRHRSAIPNDLNKGQNREVCSSRLGRR